MAKTAKTEAEPKRKVLTPAERVAKLEAELARAKEKADAKANKARNEALTRRAKLVERIEKLQAEVDSIDAQFPVETVESSTEE